MNMPNSTPLRVTPTTSDHKRGTVSDRVAHGAPWVITIGDTNRDISGHSTKKSALKMAEMKARDGNRPGVVVEKRDGSFQKFVPNDNYWKEARW